MKICDLKKDLGKFSLDIKNMVIEPDKIHGLIGANGCGKTTLMKLISGILKPDSGNIDFGGLCPRDITMIPRKPYLLHDTVYNNLIYPLKIRKIKPDKALIDEYLEICGLQDSREQYAPALSSGQQQKLALIRGLIFSPKLILIDEAFSGMDIEGAASLENLIFSFQKLHAATLLVTSHQLSHIGRICGHVFFMHNGSLECEGTAADILTKPENPRLQRYLQYETIKKEL